MPRPTFEIHLSPKRGETTVRMDGQELSSVRRVVAEHRIGEFPVVTLEIAAEKVTVNGETLLDLVAMEQGAVADEP